MNKHLLKECKLVISKGWVLGLRYVMYKNVPYLKESCKQRKYKCIYLITILIHFLDFLAIAVDRLFLVACFGILEGIAGSFAFVLCGVSVDNNTLYNQNTKNSWLGFTKTNTFEALNIFSTISYFPVKVLSTMFH